MRRLRRRRPVWRGVFVRALGLLAPLLGAWGCTGIKIGPVGDLPPLGLGAPLLGAYRGVGVKGQWSPDERYVVVWKSSGKHFERALMFFLPLPVVSGLDTDYYKDEIFVVDLRARTRPRKLGDSENPAVCPRGTYVAYRHQPIAEIVWVKGKEVSPWHLWLANYATGEKWRLAEYAADYSFSPDGRWLAWASAVDPRQVVVNVEQPTKPQAYATEQELSKVGWSFAGIWWSKDSSRYVSLEKRAHQAEPGQLRWVRFAPPEWKMEEVGPKLTKEQRAGLIFRRLPHRPADPKKVLRTKARRFVLPKVFSVLFFPEIAVGIENLYLDLPDGTTRKLTHFWPPW